MNKQRKTAIYTWGAVNMLAVFIMGLFLFKCIDDKEQTLKTVLIYFGYAVISAFVFLNILKKYPSDNEKK